jgi:hypothetical protein
MREGSGGFDGEAEGTARRAREKQGEWVFVHVSSREEWGG